MTFYYDYYGYDYDFRMPKPEAKRYSAEEAAELVHDMSVSGSESDRFDNGSQSESSSEEEVDDYSESANKSC